MKGDVIIANQFDAVVALLPREAVHSSPVDEPSDEETSEESDSDAGGINHEQREAGGLDKHHCRATGASPLTDVSG